jgi:hypothetical protein
MKKVRWLAVLLVFTLPLAACGRDQKAADTGKSGNTSSSVGSGPSENPGKGPLQTGEAGGKGSTGSDVAGGGTATGARSTPSPK